jgi:purine-nucleoside/S-methyl-5'-thioadenosine phosphorylase / adenosine deaminase
LSRRDLNPLPLLRPAWRAPHGVQAAMSLRDGGVSAGPWVSLNLGVGAGDDPAAVAENRRRFAAALGARPVWLRQVHGSRVVRLERDTDDSPAGPADAAWTSEQGLACTIQVADCMPVLLALRDGSAVAAAHAGWRGLSGGVVEATVTALCEGTGAVPGEVVAWLGPCIGPLRYEVGADVLLAFGADPDDVDGLRFRARPRDDGSRRWLANLPLLASDRLAAAGVRDVSASDACTFEDGSRFFSFRRERVTGRLAAAVWRR